MPDANNRKYDWDDNKRDLNMRHHGLDFNDVAEFDWDNAVHERSDRGGETRYVAVGVLRDKLYAVVYTERQGITRIISFRRANDKEEIRYAAA